MPLSVGARIGVYEITAAIGAGGMGQVFRARDRRLNRDVAIKVLPDSFANDQERVARFEREAQVLAALNHPNIAHVYGIEEAPADPAIRALVMELVDGEDLAAQIARGPMSLDDAIPIAIQVAHALEAAHDQGIVHRDLKPANIKLGANGTVKVLDFGLAKLGLSGATDTLGATGAITSPATIGGAVLGTAAYMSPEQARGKVVDHRSDIWSFGVVLYEMVTGRTMFAGDSVGDTIAAVLTREPSLEALPATTPPAVRRTLHRCLQKDPARRIHHIADARIELEHATTEPAVVSADRSPSRTRWWPAVALVAVSVIAAAAVVWTLLSRPAQAPRRFNLVVPDAGFNTVSMSAISPDGKWIAYAPNQHTGPFPLLLRPLDGVETRQVTAGPTTGYNPFFSEDGRWLAYVVSNTLYRVPVSGGGPERVAPVPNGLTDGAWAEDGTILLSGNFRFDGVVRHPVARLRSGSFAIITRPGQGEAHHDVHILPGSKTALFTIVTPATASIAAIPLDGGTPRVVLEDARRPRYGRGHLLFKRESTGDLMSIAFDADRLTTAGEPIRIGPVAQMVESPGFDMARDGTIIYSRPDDTTAQDGFTAVLVNRTGTESTVVAQMGSWAEPRISPDGRTLVVRNVVSPNCVLWSVDLERGTKTRVGFDADNHGPIWRADGQLTWGAEVEGARTIVMGRVDRPSVTVTQLAASGNERVPDSWTPDGALLAFTEMHPEKGQDLWLFDAKSDAVRPFLSTGANENQARFSRDGKWLAYVSNESGRNEVYLQPIDGNGARVQVSIDGGSSPLWSPNGEELFFVDEAALMQVSIDLRAARPEISQPRKIIEGPYVWDRSGNYDITPDGQRFVFIRRTEETDPSATLRVLIDWITTAR